MVCLVVIVIWVGVFYIGVMWVLLMWVSVEIWFRGLNEEEGFLLVVLMYGFFFLNYDRI